MATLTEDFTLTGWPWTGWREALTGVYTAWTHDEAADDIRTTSAVSYALAYRNTEVWDPDTQSSKVTLTGMNGTTGSSRHVGAVCRAQPDHSHILFMCGGTASVMVAQLFRVDAAGTRTALSTAEVITHLADTDYVTLQVVAGVLVGSINGVQITNQTIPIPAEANEWGTTGFYMWSSIADRMRISDWEGIAEISPLGFNITRDGINLPGAVNIGKSGLIL